MNIPMTAHILGGAPIGDSAQTGVIDPWQRVYGHDGIHVVDGAAVSANLGVNPSLTITAQAERAMSFWPNKGEADPRPHWAATYRPVDAVRPATPPCPRPHPRRWHGDQGRSPASGCAPSRGAHPAGDDRRPHASWIPPR